MESKYFHKLLANKSVLLHFVLLIVIALSLMAATGQTIMSYNESEAIEQQIRSMQAMVGDYNGKQEIVKSAAARPIPSDKLDDLQTNILLKIEAHKLNLSKLTASGAEQKGSKNKIFEMELKGEYENLMSFLADFQGRDALISILSFAMEPEREGLKMNLKYKIYVK